MHPPPPEAPFAEKMAYYRTQHTSAGVRTTHLAGVPVIAVGIPLIVARPVVGVAMFVAGWVLQIFGHIAFEKNMPSTHKGWITYQLTCVIDVCEMYGEMLARRSQRKAIRRAERAEAARRTAQAHIARRAKHAMQSFTIPIE